MLGHYAFDGTTGEYLSTPAVSGKYDLRVHHRVEVQVSRADWSASSGVVASRGRDQVPWWFYSLYDEFRTRQYINGVFRNYEFAWPTSPALPVDEPVWLAVQVLGDNGNGGHTVTVEYSLDENPPAGGGSGWVQFGQEDTTTNAGQISGGQSSAAVTRVGVRASADDSTFHEWFSDKMHRLRIVEMDGGAAVECDLDFTTTTQRTGTSPDTWEDQPSGFEWTAVGSPTYVEASDPDPSEQTLTPDATVEAGLWFVDPDDGTTLAQALAEPGDEHVVVLALDDAPSTLSASLSNPSGDLPAGDRVLSVNAGRFGSNADVTATVREGSETGTIHGTVSESFTSDGLATHTAELSSEPSDFDDLFLRLDGDAA